MCELGNKYIYVSISSNHKCCIECLPVLFIEACPVLRHHVLADMLSTEHIVGDGKSNLGRSHQCQLAIGDNGEQQVVAHEAFVGV